MNDYNGITENKCYRNGPCLNADPIRVARSEKWDYYDRESKSFINLQCRLNQKHYSASLLQIEEGEKFQSGLSTVTYETPDLQLHDTNGVWFTRSDDPDMYGWPPAISVIWSAISEMNRNTCAAMRPAHTTIRHLIPFTRRFKIAINHARTFFTPFFSRTFQRSIGGEGGQRR